MRSGRYEWHRLTISRRLAFDGVAEALDDDTLIGDLYQTLQKWGIGRRASRLVPLPAFRAALRTQTARFQELETLRIDDPELDAAEVARRIWELIESLRIVENRSLIVPGTKTVHHLLPNLVPPMDRAWTGAFFLWSVAAPQSAQRTTFDRAFIQMARIGAATNPRNYVGSGWRTSLSKTIDNAIIGYCKDHGIHPANT